MPWRISCPMDERVKFIAMLLERGDMSMSRACQAFAISRKTGYKWLNRYRQDQHAGLAELSRAPRSNCRAIDQRTGEIIVALRRRYPYWGAKKLRVLLLRDFPAVRCPSASSIGCLLQREGLIKPRHRRLPGIRVAREDFLPMHDANQVWCVDFKAPIVTGQGRGYAPLTVSDGASRFLLECRFSGMKGEQLWPRFELLFRSYGMPAAIRSDNGPPFASTGLQGLTPLAIKWCRLGIKLERTRPAHPEENGRHERLHGSLSQYLGSQPRPPDLSSLQRQLDLFVYEYNNIRPHQALGGQTPSSCYRASSRRYPERIPEPEYACGWHVRRIRNNGYVHFKGRFIYMSDALDGQLVGITEMQNGDYLVKFCALSLGLIDRNTYKFKRFSPCLKARGKDKANKT